MKRRSFLQMLGLAPIAATAVVDAARSAPAPGVLLDGEGAPICLFDDDGTHIHTAFVDSVQFNPVTVSHFREPRAGDPEESVWLYTRSDGKQVIAARVKDGVIHEMWWKN